MQTYRVGDEVLIEVPAVVTNTERQNPEHGGVVRVRFGDIEYSAKLGAMIMIKPSVHVGDHVLHEDRPGKIVQKLEKNVFLMRYDDAEGANAYGVVNGSDVQHIQHAPEYHAPHASVKTAEAPVLELNNAIEEQAEEKAAIPSLTNIVAEEFDAPKASEAEVLVLEKEASGDNAISDEHEVVEEPVASNPVHEEEHHHDEEGNEPEEEPVSNVTTEARLMASALSGLVGKANAARRKPIDLEALGGSTDIVENVSSTSASESSSTDSNE